MAKPSELRKMSPPSRQPQSIRSQSQSPLYERRDQSIACGKDKVRLCRNGTFNLELMKQPVWGRIRWSSLCSEWLCWKQETFPIMARHSPYYDSHETQNWNLKRTSTFSSITWWRYTALPMSALQKHLRRSMFRWKHHKPSGHLSTRKAKGEAVIARDSGCLDAAVVEQGHLLVLNLTSLFF